jgi:hypothetical protein
MILRFAVENYRSFRDRAEISFVSTARKDEPAMRLPCPGTRHGVLPVVGAWGANASGKSNLLAALVELRSMVADSFSDLQPSEPISWAPWRLDTSPEVPPTSMDIDFLVEGVRHHYGFRYIAEGIVEEWLFAWPKRLQRVLFHRNHAEEEPWYFGPSLRDTKRIELATRRNCLLLSAAAHHEHEQLTGVWRALVQGIVSGERGLRTGPPLFRPDSAILRPEVRSMLLAMLAAADLDVTGVREVERPDANVEAWGTAHAGSIDRGRALGEAGPRRELWLTHGTSGEDGWELPPSLESRGTQVFLVQLDLLLHALGTGALCVIDDLEQALHPDLCAAMLRLFTRPENNKAGAQLLFSAHSRELLAHLRTDEVVLVERSGEGASSLRAASEFRALRTRDDLRRAHEQGRLGGVPVLGDLGAAAAGVHDRL